MSQPPYDKVKIIGIGICQNQKRSQPDKISSQLLVLQTLARIGLLRSATVR